MNRERASGLYLIFNPQIDLRLAYSPVITPSKICVGNE
jgi:hypothetical protein